MHDRLTREQSHYSAMRCLEHGDRMERRSAQSGRRGGGGGEEESGWGGETNHDLRLCVSSSWPPTDVTTSIRHIRRFCAGRPTTSPSSPPPPPFMLPPGLFLDARVALDARGYLAPLPTIRWTGCIRPMGSLISRACGKGAKLWGGGLVSKV